MNPSQCLLLATCALSLYSVGNIWPVQVSSYRLWTHVGPREFRAYHLAWWHSIWGVILAPAVLVFVGALLMLWWPASGVPRWAPSLGFALQAALVVGTALWWGPLMARLEDASGALAVERFRLLMATHWLRVMIVTAYGVLTLWMLAESAWLGTARADTVPIGVLSVRLVGLRNDHGRSGCMLFDSAKGFPKDAASALRRIWCPIASGESICRFDPVAARTYAVACFHDENGNGQCDTGFLGIPTEGTVVSNEAKGFMGPPSFKDARFSFSGHATELRLRMGY